MGNRGILTLETNHLPMQMNDLSWLSALLLIATAVVIQINLRITKKYLSGYGNAKEGETKNERK